MEFILLGIVSLIVVGIMTYDQITINRLKKENLNIQKNSRSKNISQAVNKGLLLEQLAPWTTNFPYEPSDMKFLGAPIDYIIFEGMQSNDITKVILVEIKTGRSTLSGREKQIRQCINEGKVSFETIRFK